MIVGCHSWKFSKGNRTMCTARPSFLFYVCVCTRSRIVVQWSEKFRMTNYNNNVVYIRITRLCKYLLGIVSWRIGRKRKRFLSFKVCVHAIPRFNSVCVMFFAIVEIRTSALSECEISISRMQFVALSSETSDV